VTGAQGDAREVIGKRNAAAMQNQSSVERRELSLFPAYTENGARRIAEMNVLCQASG